MSISPVLVLLDRVRGPAGVGVDVAGRRRAPDRGSARRRARGWPGTCSTSGPRPGPGKEIRVDGTARASSCDRRRDAWDDVVRRVSRAAVGERVRGTPRRGRCSVSRTSARSCSSRPGSNESAGDVLLALAAGANLSRYLGVTVGQAEFLRWTLDAAQRLAWLEDYAVTHRGRARHAGAGPTRERRSGSSTSRSGTRAPTRGCCDDVNLELARRIGRRARRRERRRQDDAREAALPVLRADRGSHHRRRRRSRAASRPRSGASACRARSRTSSGSSTTRCTSIGVGDLERVDDEPAVRRGGRRAPAPTDVVERMPHGLDTQLGPTWHDGVELSIGQWQKLALARGFMRDASAALRARRADRRARRRDRARVVRTLRGRVTRRRATTAASRSSCRTVSRRSAWPTRSSCSTARTSSSPGPTTS